MEAEIFPYLVIGLAEFLEKEARRYPYPDTLQYSLNKLSLLNLLDHPKTLDGLLNKFESPLRNWWKGTPPPAFAPDESLIEDGELSFAAIEYLDQLTGDETPFQDSLSKVEIVLDNRKFRQLLDRLRQAFLTDPINAQNEYVELRYFIIRHPYAKLVDIGQKFSQTRYINVNDVAELYTEANRLADVMHYPDDNKQNVFWLCEHCGPLYVKYDQRESVKLNACGKHCPRHQGGWKAVSPSRQLLVLRRGIHLRVHLPGLPELRLLEWLEEKKREYPQFLLNIHPWPGLDSYDIQLQFSESTWAVDVKDYQDPNILGRKLIRLNREGNLYWDEGFYIYPSYREIQRQDYGEAVRQEALPRLQGIQIISDETFKEQVIKKLESLKRGKTDVYST